MILTVCAAAQTSVVTAQVRAVPKPGEPIRPTPTISSLPQPVNDLPPTTLNRPVTVTIDPQILPRASGRTVSESGVPVSTGGGNDSLGEHEHGHPHENQETGDDSIVTATTSAADPADTTLLTAPPNAPPPAKPSPPSSIAAPPQERPNPNHTVELLVAMLLCLMLLLVRRRSAREQ
jgi:hypothetical protein